MKTRVTFKTLTLAAAMTSLLGFASATLANDDYDKALEEAKTAEAAAKGVNNQWFYKKNLIEQAEAAAKADDYDTAIKLAKKAKFQGDMAVAQYEEQKNAGPYPVR